MIAPFTTPSQCDGSPARGAPAAPRSYRRAVTTAPPATDLLARLGAVLPADRLVTDPDVLGSYAHDEAEWAEYALPACVVRPRTAEEVQAVVRACIEFRTPLVPRGAGTGLSGGANAVAGCVVLSLERMDAVVEVDELERLAYPAVERLGPVLTEDVCVPKAAVPAMLARIEAIGVAHDVLIANIAHAG